MPDTTKERWAGGEFDVVLRHVKDRTKLPDGAQGVGVRVPAATGNLLHNLYGGITASMRELMRLMVPEDVDVYDEDGNPRGGEWSINEELRGCIAERDQAAEVDRLADFSQDALEAELDRRAEAAA